MIPVLYLHEHGAISGGEISLLALWENLDRTRFRPILAAPCPSPFADRARSAGVDVRPMSFPRMRDIMGPAGTRIVREIRRLVREEKVRIVHGNTPRTNLLGSLATLGTGCRVVWHERTLPESEWDVDRWLRFLPDRIICNSAAVARRFHGLGKVVVILNGVLLDRFRQGAGGAALRAELGVGPQEVLVGIVGNFSPVKGHEVFIRAASRLAVREKAIRFWIVGGETFADNKGRGEVLRALVGDLGLGKYVQFLGPCEDMPAIMDAVDMLAAPSYLEACSRAILEAMAAGKPVIATNVGGNPELVEDGGTGVLVAPRDVDALADAIRRLAPDASLRRRMGEAARKRAETAFSVVRQAHQTQVLYDKLLSISKMDTCCLCGGTQGQIVERVSSIAVVRCVCGLVFVTPQPPRHALEQAYEEAYYGPWEKQAALRSRIWQQRLARVENFVLPPGRLLDVGCGTGAFLGLAQAQGWDVTGTEFSAYACEAAEARRFKVFKGEVWEAKLPAEAFDVITCWHVIEHVADPMRVMEEISRILRPGGWLFLATPNVDDYIFRAAYIIARRRRPLFYEPGEREVHLFNFSGQTLGALVARAHLQVVEVGFDRGAAAEWGKRVVNGLAHFWCRLTGLNWGMALELVGRKPDRRL